MPHLIHASASFSMLFLHVLSQHSLRRTFSRYSSFLFKILVELVSTNSPVRECHRLDWWPPEGVPCLQSIVSWDYPSLPHSLKPKLYESVIKDEWMDGLVYESKYGMTELFTPLDFVGKITLLIWFISPKVQRSLVFRQFHSCSFCSPNVSTVLNSHPWNSFLQTVYHLLSEGA